MTQQSTTAPSPILQDWAPLTHCLDWHLGQFAFQHRGAQAFTSNEVPNLVTQGGMRAYKAAEVLLENCREAEAAGKLEDEIVCLELAMGLGVFAVQVLDRFQQRCNEMGKDWYERLTWYATDVTPKMLRDAKKNEVFARHASCVILARADALNPGVVAVLDGEESIDLSGKLRCVFHSYLLCVLPANLFRRTTITSIDGETKTSSWNVLMARTVLRQPDGLRQFSNLSVDGVRALAASRHSQDLLRLVPLYPLMDVDVVVAPLADDNYEARPELDRIADLLEARLAENPAPADTPATENLDEPTATETNTWVLHSAGAMASVEATLKILRPDGFLLYSDYGPASARVANTPYLHQRYGATTAIGVNHVALDSWFSGTSSDGEERGISTWPEGELEAALKTRLVSRGAIPATRSTFVQQFDPASFNALQRAVVAARAAAAEPEKAMDGYRQALAMERDNWALLAEAADFALRRLRNLQLAQVLVSEALRINPWYAARAWNCLGDIYWYSNQIDASEEAFRRATQANPEAHTGWYNLYLVARHRGDLEQAIEMAAKAVAMDRNGLASVRLEAALADATKLLKAQREAARGWRKARVGGTLV